MSLARPTPRETALRLLEWDPEESLGAPRSSLLGFSRLPRREAGLGSWSVLSRRWLGHPDKDLERGLLLLRLGLPDAAVSPLERAAADGEAGASELLGEALAGAGRLESALATLERAVAARPDRLWARLWLAECLRRTGRPRDASRARAEIRRRWPDSPWPALAAGRAGDARELARGAALAPREAWARLALGWSLLERGQSAAAEAELSAGLARAPERRWALVLRARARLERGAFESSRSDLEAVLRLGPDLGSARRAWREGDARDAERRALDRAIARRPDEGWVRAWRGQLGFDALRPEAALDDLRRGVALDPACGWARAFLARAEGVWRGEAREDEMTRAFGDAPDCGWILLWRGLLRSRGGDAAGAGRDFAAAAKSRPDHALARGWLAERRRALGDLGGALVEGDAACELDPGYGLHFDRRRRTLWSLGRADSAFEDMELAVRREGRLRWARGRGAAEAAGAAAELSAFLEKRPGHAGALAWRGETRLESGDAAGALADLDAALALRPGAARPRAWRAELLLSRGELGAALVEADAASACEPGYARAWGAKARAAAALGLVRPALEAYGRAIELDFGAAWAYVERARLLLSAGRRREALSDLERARALDPRGEAAAGLLARARGGTE